jgi:hypothetical protein
MCLGSRAGIEGRSFLMLYLEVPQTCSNHTKHNYFMYVASFTCNMNRTDQILLLEDLQVPLGYDISACITPLTRIERCVGCAK